jgi:uncharacterized protein (DUF2237 family)
MTPYNTIFHSNISLCMIKTFRKGDDRWCLCALRWKEALDAGVAPPVILEATHESALLYVSLEDLKRHARHDV